MEKLDLSVKTDQLKKLIAEHPDYEIAVLAGENATGSDQYYTYCSEIRFEIGEYFNADNSYRNSDETLITDRENLEDLIGDWLFDEHGNAWTETEYQNAIHAEMKRLEECWTPCIFIYADN